MNNAIGGYRIKIDLSGVNPSIWRVVEVPSGTTLNQAHMIIQIVMGWNRSGRYSFEIAGVVCDVEHEGVDFMRQINVDDVIKPHQPIYYTYHLTYQWEHRVTVLKVCDDLIQVPRCTHGELAIPPSGSLGPELYEQYLRALSDESHPLHNRYRKMIEDKDLDPRHLEVDVINYLLWWYWKYRDAAVTAESLSNMVKRFLADMCEEVTQNTVSRYERDMRDFEEFVNHFGPVIMPIDVHLHRKNDIPLSEIFGIEAFLQPIEMFFYQYVSWRLAATQDRVRDYRDTLQRFAQWLIDVNLSDQHVVDDVKSRISQVAEEAIKLVRENWSFFHNWDELCAFEDMSEIVRKGYMVVRVNEDSLDLRDPFSGVTYRRVRAPRELIGNVRPDIPLAVEVGICSDNNYIIGAMISGN